MPSDPVERKLRQIIVPYLVSAQHLTTYPLYQTYEYYALLNAYVAALVGFGLAPPAIKWYLQIANGAKADLPSEVGWLALLVGFFLIGLSVYYKNKSAATRTILARTCRAELLDIDDELHAALQSSSDPQTEIIALQNKAVSIVKRYRSQHESWPWDRFAPGVEDAVEDRIKDLAGRYGPWKPGPDREERVRVTVDPNVRAEDPLRPSESSSHRDTEQQPEGD